MKPKGDLLEVPMEDWESRLWTMNAKCQAQLPAGQEVTKDLKFPCFCHHSTKLPFIITYPLDYQVLELYQQI